MRPLSPEEAALWARVTATIRSLSRRPETELKQAETVQAKPPSPQPLRRAAAPPPRPQPGTTLDGSWDRKLQSGSVVPDRILDLHGHSLDRAWSAIDLALERAIDDGDRVLLLITGHERPGSAPVRRGQIRAAVHDWLAVSRHAPRIAAVRAAHSRHGGGGSLYIILRRG
ncbi:Smr/MutS family protein [Sphingomonas sp.]|uniref:Smr/MutS family protein n=1 Tax=Sphingomonas sp. TaxID=28214 RepID=UPI00286BED56|nr:Smr/MutS family protein [Sphingomonas sp.]